MIKVTHLSICARVVDGVNCNCLDEAAVRDRIAEKVGLFVNRVMHDDFQQGYSRARAEDIATIKGERIILYEDL